MHDLRYITFDPTQALLVVAAAVCVIAGLHVFETWAKRHVRDRTRRELERALAAIATGDTGAASTSAPSDAGQHDRDRGVT